MTTFADRLSAFIADMRLPKGRLAKLLDVDPGMVSKYVKGENFPQVDVLLKLAELSGLSLDWLLGRSSTTKWGPEVLQLRLQLQANAPAIEADDAQERMKAIISLMQKVSPVCGQDWFIQGITGAHGESFTRFMTGPVNRLPAHMSARLSDFTGLSEDWILDGDPEDLALPNNYGDYSGIVLQFARDGIHEHELRAEYPYIVRRVLQHRPQSTTDPIE